MPGFGGAVQVASLYAKLGADTSDFERAMKNSHGVLGKTQAALGTLVKVGIGGAVAGFGALATGIGFSIRSASAFDKVMSGAGAVLNATSDEMEKLNSLALQLGKDTAFSASEAASAIEILGQQGLSARNILDGAASATVALAEATATNLTTAADVAATAMSLFDIKAEDMMKAVDGISGVTNASRFQIEDYSKALAMGGGVAAKLGVTFGAFNNVIAATATSFSSGSDAGTSFKTFLQRLVPQGKPAIEAMQRLNLITKEGKNLFFDASGNLQDFAVIAGMLKKSLGGLSDEAKSSALFDIFGADASRMALALAAVGAEGITATKAIIDSTSAAEQARKRMDNLAGDTEEASGSFETLGITIGKAFTPLARKGMQSITAFLNRLIEIDFTPFAKGVEGVFNSIVQAFSGTGDIFARLGNMKNMDLADRLIESWSIFGDWAKGLWELVSPLLGRFWNELEQWIEDPVRRSKILAAINRTWIGFLRWAGSLWDNIKPALDAMWASLSTWTLDPLKSNTLTAMALRMVQGLWSWTTGLWGIIGPALVAMWNNLTSWVTDPVKIGILISGIGTLMGAFWKWAVTVWDAVSPYLGSFFSGLISWVTDDTKRTQLSQALTSAWTSFVDWSFGVWDSVSPYLSSFFGYLTSWVTDETKRTQLLGALSSAWTFFWDWAGSVWDLVSPALLQAWTYLTSWVTDPNKRETLLSALGTAWTFFTDWALAVWNFVQPALASVWENLTSWVTVPEKRKELFNSLSKAWTSFTDWAGSVWEWASPKLAQFWIDITSWITDPSKRNELLDTLSRAWTSFTDWAGAVWGWMSPMLNGVWTFLTSWITDSDKRTTLFNTISASWTSFTDWAGTIWYGSADNPGGLSAKLGSIFSSLNEWIDKNIPNMKPWKDQFIGFVQGAAAQWNLDFPAMQASVTNLVDKVITEVPKMGKVFAELWGEIFGNGESSGAGLVNILTSLFEGLSSAIGTVLTQLRIMSEYLLAVVRAAKAMGSGNWDEVARQGQVMIDLWNQFTQVTGDQWSEFTDMMNRIVNGSPSTNTGGNTGGNTDGNTGGGGAPTYNGPYDGAVVENNGVFWIWRNNRWERLSGYARGGRVNKSGTYLTGENGPELVSMGAGSQVYNSQQTSSMLANRTLHITLDVNGSGNLPMDRMKLQELSRALLNEMQLRGLQVTG